MEINSHDKYFRTERDKIMSLSEYISSVMWEGENLTITGSQPEDYRGVTSSFVVTMTTDIALKFFGCARLFDAKLSDKNGVVRISV